MERKPKVLIFIDWFHPGYKAGGPVRSNVNLVEHLGDRVEFFVVTSDTDYLEERPYEGVERGKWVEFRSNPEASGSEPDARKALVWYMEKGVSFRLQVLGFRRIIEEVQPDVVFINGVYSFYFSILPLWVVKRMGKRVIISTRGMLSEHAFAEKSAKKKLFLYVGRFLGLYQNVEFHVTNEEEKGFVRRLFGKQKIWVVPNLARKISESIPKLRDKNPEPRTQRLEKEKGELRLVSIARISREKNTKFALEVLSKIKTSGTIVFDIYGSIYNEGYWEECKTIIDALPENIVVNYKGVVDSENVPEVFSRYHVSFMPSLGENFGHSLLESMCVGTVVITSRNTPWKGLDRVSAKRSVSGRVGVRGNGSEGDALVKTSMVEVGYDLPLEEPGRFVEVIEKLVEMDGERYGVISENARLYGKGVVEDPEVLNGYLEMFG